MTDEDHPSHIYDEAGAASEGWLVLPGTAIDEPWRIDRISEDAVFGDAREAWHHVCARALEGSWNHRRALAFLALRSPEAFARIGDSIPDETRSDLRAVVAPGFDIDDIRRARPYAIDDRGERDLPQREADPAVVAPLAPSAPVRVVQPKPTPAFGLS